MFDKIVCMNADYGTYVCVFVFGEDRKREREYHPFYTHHETIRLTRRRKGSNKAFVVILFQYMHSNGEGNDCDV